jgi:hypothetical protein
MANRLSTIKRQRKNRRQAHLKLTNHNAKFLGRRLAHELAAITVAAKESGDPVQGLGAAFVKNLVTSLLIREVAEGAIPPRPDEGSAGMR